MQKEPHQWHDIIVQVVCDVDAFLAVYLELGHDLDQLQPNPRLEYLHRYKMLYLDAPNMIIERLAEDPRIDAIWPNEEEYLFDQSPVVIIA